MALLANAGFSYDGQGKVFLFHLQMMTRRTFSPSNFFGFDLPVMSAGTSGKRNLMGMKCAS